ncbi:DC-STAMP domain-containing protein 2-like [Rhinophrynus dorsalis]
MAFSANVRATVLLMLSQTFTDEVKNIILVAALTLAMQGSGANIVENLSRTTMSISCTVDLAMNQTKDSAQLATAPLLPRLFQEAVDSLLEKQVLVRVPPPERGSGSVEEIKLLARKFKVAGEESGRFFTSVERSMRYIEQTLKRVWRYLHNAGDICTEKMTAPYTKCNQIFEDGKDRCFRDLSFLSFVCYIVDVFRPLCGLAKVIHIVCLPSYVLQMIVRQQHVTYLTPMMESIRDKFKFNITIIHSYNRKANTSTPYRTVVSRVTKDVMQIVDPIMYIIELTNYIWIITGLYYYIRAWLYRRRYILDDGFDNIYITPDFIELDKMRKKNGENPILPFYPREAKKYIRTDLCALTSSEKISYSAFFGIYWSMMLIGFLVLSDFFLVLLMKGIHNRMADKDFTIQAPYFVEIAAEGSGFLFMIIKDLLAVVENVLKTRLNILSKQCQLRPSETNIKLLLLIGALFLFAIVITFLGSYGKRMRRSVCAYYYPDREKERIAALYRKILSEREYEPRAVSNCRLATMYVERSFLQALATKIQGIVCFVEWLEPNPLYCRRCARVSREELETDFVYCYSVECKHRSAMFCHICMDIDNSCTYCFGELFDGEEIIIDPRDEEQITPIRMLQVEINSIQDRRKKKLRNYIKADMKAKFEVSRYSDLGQGCPSDLHRIENGPEEEFDPSDDWLTFSETPPT